MDPSTDGSLIYTRADTADQYEGKMSHLINGTEKEDVGKN